MYVSTNIANLTYLIKKKAVFRNTCDMWRAVGEGLSRPIGRG